MTFWLAAYYFGFYGVLGALLPYFALWMDARELSAAQIGWILGTHGAMRVVVPLAWGMVADRLGQHLPVVRLTTVASLLGFALMPVAEGFGGILTVVVLFSLFWNATMPQVEAITLNYLSRLGGDYSRVRLWGSVGFVLTVVGLGILFERVGVEPWPWIIIALIAGMCAVSLRLDEAPDPDHADTGPEPIMAALRQPGVLALLGVCFLSQLSFAPYYGFFSLYLELHDYSRDVIGLLWAFGVIVEIWMFLYTGRLLERYGAYVLLVLAMASTALRWAALVVAVDWLPGLILVQTLHLSSFGVYHVAAMHYVHRLFPGRLQGRGQALYVGVSFGLGGAIGAALSGQAWDAISPDAIYWGAAIAGLLGTILAWSGLRVVGGPPSNQGIGERSGDA